MSTTADVLKLVEAIRTNSDRMQAEQERDFTVRVTCEYAWEVRARSAEEAVRLADSMSTADATEDWSDFVVDPCQESLDPDHPCELEPGHPGPCGYGQPREHDDDCILRCPISPSEACHIGHGCWCSPGGHPK